MERPKAFFSHELGEVCALESDLAVEHVGLAAVEVRIGLEGLSEFQVHRVGPVPTLIFRLRAQIDYRGALWNAIQFEVGNPQRFQIQLAELEDCASGDGGFDERSIEFCFLGLDRLIEAMGKAP